MIFLDFPMIFLENPGCPKLPEAARSCPKLPEAPRGLTDPPVHTHRVGGAYKLKKLAA